jgi:branched-chain amino acid transport system ATP-binding protein
MSEYALRVRGLYKHFVGVHAADDVNLEVEPGEFRAIIGPNGAGKSTLFNMISGFIRPDRGQVFFDGKDITGRPPYRLFHLGISRTFQITNIFGDLTVLENVQSAVLSKNRRLLAIFGRTRGAYIDECRALLDLVGLPNAEHRAAAELSHGDQKRLELAVALANKPRLLLLDEPTAGMAAQERVDSIRMVHRIARQLGITVIFTEHDMQVVFAVADMISVLHQGKVLTEGKPHRIRDDPDVQKIYLGEQSGITAASAKTAKTVVPAAKFGSKGG